MVIRYFERKIEIPEGCSVVIDNALIKITSPKGNVQKDMKNKLVKSEVTKDSVLLYAEKNTKTFKKLVFTFSSHLKNMLTGLVEGHKYVLKICSGHFPMSVAVKGNKFEVKNFIGENKPRILKLHEGVSVKMNGTEIVVESIDKELAGQTAASIEQLTRRPGFDRRIFQDGIYITEKDGKKI